MNRQRAIGGSRREENPLRLNIARVHVPLSAVLAAWAGRKVAAGLSWLLRHPWVFAPLALVWCGQRLVDGHGTTATLLVLVAVSSAMVAWRLAWPGSFTRLVAWRLRGWWRSMRVYRFGWQPAMVTTGLAVRVDGEQYLPRLLGVHSTATVDRVYVRMLPGQVLDDWSSVAPRLAQTFDARECRVRTTRFRQQLELWFLVEDPLNEPVSPDLTGSRERSSEAPDLVALPVARREDGLTYRLRLLGSHLLVVGATGSGKGSVIWSLLHAAGPLIRDGVVSVWCIDPKGGMELALGRRLFARFVYGDPDHGNDFEAEFAEVLEDAVAVMRRRQAALRGVTRLHTPTVSEPLVLVVVDELASLTAYVSDRDAKRRIGSALSLLLSQGRAVGVSVVGAVQDPRKEVISVRDLFPTRVALRLSEADHVGLVLGQGARDRGARCDQIPESLPGVGYVAIDGVAEPIRVRFAHVTDEHIATMIDQFAPRSRAVAELERSSQDGNGPGWAA